MADKYYRGLKESMDDTKYKLQLASMSLKINENKNNINGIKNDISGINDFSGKIDTNENDISNNLTKINDNESNITYNLTKLNNIKNNMTIKIKKDIYEKTFIISTMTTNFNSKKIARININSIFTTNGIIKINTNYNYSYDDSNNFSHLYKFYNNNRKFKKFKLNHNKTLDEINDKFNIPGVNSKRMHLLIYLINNNNNNSSVKLCDSTIKIFYNVYVESLKSDINKDNIASNLSKINRNKDDISANLKKLIMYQKII